ncbi:MAG: 3-hydroxyacyl-CoA dehydrogenase NAD-binding domain-containing protein, partial [Gammaproteobacteria bacterium]
PEVKLGIHPAWGGTVRMPRLIGPLQGLELVMTGRNVSAKSAAKMGFIDAAVPERHLVTAAKYYVLQRPSPRKATWLQSLLNKQPLRRLLANIMRKKLRAKVNPKHYPAPFQVVDNWENTGVEGMHPFEVEAQTAAKLFLSKTSHNLVRVFFLQERLKGLAKESSFKPQRVHVIGAGTMGGDIAAWCALQGLHVTLQDREAKYIAPAIKRAYALFKEKLKEPYLVQQAMDRLTPDTAGYGVERADVIVEAIFEDLTAKQNLFKSLEARAKPSAILATNTSSIPLDEINTVMERPERLVGIHFFNPVAKMMLVEVVHSERTDKATADKAAAFVRKIERLPLPVKSSPGFLVNRILMPYLLEAMNLLEEGVPAQAIDKAMLNFGMPMGPITLADTVGLDICLSVAKHLSKYLNTSVPPRLIKMVEEGKLGRKSGEGFYKYKDGKKIKTKDVAYEKPLDEISDRLVLRMIDESFACLREQVVADGDLLDAGMIFGTGFAPFRGGPIHYAKSKGIHELYQKYLKQLQMRGEKVDSSKSWEAVDA